MEFRTRDSEIVKFCPEFGNFVVRQGINSEFCGNLAALASIGVVAPQTRAKRQSAAHITGKQQGILIPSHRDFEVELIRLVRGMLIPELRVQSRQCLGWLFLR
jgi:hypothetical protein